MSACGSPPQLTSSYIVQTAASMAQAASTALPPRSNMRAPAVAPSGLPVMATQWRPCKTGLCVSENGSGAAAKHEPVMSKANTDLRNGTVCMMSRQTKQSVRRSQQKSCPRRWMGRAIDKVLAHADCQSAIQPIDNRRYSVAQTGSLLCRRLLTGCGCATPCAKFVNGPSLNLRRPNKRIALPDEDLKLRPHFPQL